MNSSKTNDVVRGLPFSCIGAYYESSFFFCFARLYATSDIHL